MQSSKTNPLENAPIEADGMSNQMKACKFSGMTSGLALTKKYKMCSHGDYFDRKNGSKLKEMSYFYEVHIFVKWL